MPGTKGYGSDWSIGSDGRPYSPRQIKANHDLENAEIALVAAKDYALTQVSKYGAIGYDSTYISQTSGTPAGAIIAQAVTAQTHAGIVRDAAYNVWNAINAEGSALVGTFE